MLKKAQAWRAAAEGEASGHGNAVEVAMTLSGAASHPDLLEHSGTLG